MLWNVRRWIASRIYYGWIIALACLLAAMTVFGTTYTFGVFFEVFLSEFRASRTLLAFVFGVQTAILYIAGVPAGEAIERIGQRRVILISGVVFAGGLVWAGAARSYAELLVSFGIVTAIGMAGLYVVGYATIPVWFKRRRGAAAGFASAGLGIGLVVFPPVIEWLIAMVGWRTSMGVLAMGVLGLSVVVWVLFVDHPRAVGASLSREFPTGGPDHDTTPHEQEHPWDRIVRIMSSRTFVLVFVGWILVFAPLYALMSHIVLFAEHAGLSRSVGVLGITVIGITTTLSRMVVGVLSDLTGRTRTFVFCSVLIGSMVIVLPFVSTVVVFFLVLVAYGIGYGGAGGLIGPQVADFFGDTDINTTFAMLSLSFAISGMVSAPLAGFGFERFGGYAVPFIGLGVIGIIGAGIIVLEARYTSPH